MNAASNLKVWINDRPVELKGDNNYFDTTYGEKDTYTPIVAAVGNFAESYEKKLIA